MVHWFDPVQLAGTGVQVGVSSVFGSYSDKREIQAALAPDAKPHHEHADRRGALVRLRRRPRRRVRADLHGRTLPRPAGARLEREGSAWDTQRGRILVMGGDQVYPTATRTEYENRLVGPYRAALPFVYPDPPRVYAIPGNHDWYDGLTNFMRVFSATSGSGPGSRRRSAATSPSSSHTAGGSGRSTSSSTPTSTSRSSPTSAGRARYSSRATG